MPTVERFGRNTLTIVDEVPGGSGVYGSTGSDDCDALERFGKGRMHYPRQFGCLYNYLFCLNQMQKRRTRRVLYAGCNSDYLRRIMAENYCICDEYVGVDLHLPKLREALRFTNAIAADYYCQDLSRPLRWEDDHFDAVIALDVVEHLPTREKGVGLIHELARVCSDLLIISTPQTEEGVRSSDMHKYEFSAADHASFMKEVGKKFWHAEKHGMHMGSREYSEVVKAEPLLMKMHEFMGPKVMRGLVASAFPEKANDVILCFSKGTPIAETI